MRRRVTCDIEFTSGPVLLEGDSKITDVSSIPSCYPSSKIGPPPEFIYNAISRYGTGAVTNGKEAVLALRRFLRSIGGNE